MKRNNLPLRLRELEFSLLNTLKKGLETIACAVEVVADTVDVRGKVSAKALRENGELVFWENHENFYDDFYA